MKDYEQRFNDTTVELREDQGVTHIAGYAAVFNKESHDVGGFKEVIKPGAFKRLLSRGEDVQARFNHDADQLLASRNAGTLKLHEDNVGLRYEFPIDMTDPDHQRVAAKIRRGDLKGSSFAFRAVGGDKWATNSDGYPLRVVSDVSALRDVGPASKPAYPDTAISGALALRSLAEKVDLPVEDLVEAAGRDELAALLLSLDKRDAPEDSRKDASEEVVQPQTATEDDADSRKDADSPEVRTRVMPPRHTPGVLTLTERYGS